MLITDVAIAMAKNPAIREIKRLKTKDEELPLIEKTVSAEINDPNTTTTIVPIRSCIF